MNKHFEHLKSISAKYRNAVDDLAPQYEAEGVRDHQFNDEIKTQRLQERNARYNGMIDNAAQEAVEAATVEINKLRETVRAYVTDTKDTAKVQTLQALLSAGVELSSTEIAAFSDGAGYAVLRLLEKPSKGHIQAPRLDSFKNDLTELESHFRDLSAYRGEMAAASTASPWGLAPSVGSTIMRGKIDHFADKLIEIASRWDVLLG